MADPGIALPLHLSLKASRISRSGIVDDTPAVVQFPTHCEISIINHRIVEFPVQIDNIDHQSGTIGSELPYDLTVRLNETGWIRGKVTARI